MTVIVYVSCADDKVIVVLEMDPGSGTLRERARVAIPGTDEPSGGSLPMAVSPDHRFLYAGLRTPPFPISSFVIDPGDGGLTHVGMANLPDSMCYLSTDRSGRVLFSASYGGSTLAVSPIAGGIVQDSTQVLATPPKAHSVRVDPANRFVYAACLGGEAVLCQRFDAGGGSIEPVPRIAANTRPGAGPRHIQFARGGTLLYLINELDGSINTYARDVSTGGLNEVQSISLLQAGVSGRVAAADLHLSPDERFLYGSERKTNVLAAFRVDPASGALSLIGHVASEPTPRGFAIEPRGKFLLCAGLSSGTVGVYAIDQATGALSRRSGLAVGNGPNWIEILSL